jgi:hypothetical protein
MRLELIETLWFSRPFLKLQQREGLLPCYCLVGWKSRAPHYCLPGVGNLGSLLGPYYPSLLAGEGMVKQG